MKRKKLNKIKYEEQEPHNLRKRQKKEIVSLFEKFLKTFDKFFLKNVFQFFNVDDLKNLRLISKFFRNLVNNFIYINFPLSLFNLKLFKNSNLDKLPFHKFTINNKNDDNTLDLILTNNKEEIKNDSSQQKKQYLKRKSNIITNEPYKHIIDNVNQINLLYIDYKNNTPFKLLDRNDKILTSNIFTNLVILKLTKNELTNNFIDSINQLKFLIKLDLKNIIPNDNSVKTITFNSSSLQKLSLNFKIFQKKKICIVNNFLQLNLCKNLKTLKISNNNNLHSKNIDVYLSLRYFHQQFFQIPFNLYIQNLPCSITQLKLLIDSNYIKFSPETCDFNFLENLEKLYLPNIIPSFPLEKINIKKLKYLLFSDEIYLHKYSNFLSQTNLSELSLKFTVSNNFSKIYQNPIPIKTLVLNYINIQSLTFLKTLNFDFNQLILYGSFIFYHFFNNNNISINEKNPLIFENVKSLSFKTVNNLSFENILFIFKFFPNIEQLSFINCTGHLTTKNLILLIQHYSNLQKFSIKTPYNNLKEELLCLSNNFKKKIFKNLNIQIKIM